MGLFDFGGTDKKAIKAQQEENALARQLIREMGMGSRDALLQLFPSIVGARSGGTQGAIDMMGQYVPEMFGAFQQGNVGAQQALLGGLGQVQNAILGLPVNMDALQPQAINYDTSFTDVSLPGLFLGGQPPPVAITPDAPIPDTTGNTYQPGGLSGQGGGRSTDVTGYQGANIGHGGVGGAGGGITPTGTPFSGFGGGGGQGAMDWTNGALDWFTGGGQQPAQQSGNALDWLGRHAGAVGTVASLLSGIPGLGRLGSWFENRYEMNNPRGVMHPDSADYIDPNATPPQQGMMAPDSSGFVEPGGVSRGYRTGLGSNMPWVGRGKTTSGYRTGLRAGSSSVAGGGSNPWYASRLNVDN